jgi:hypothetical protein
MVFSPVLIKINLLIGVLQIIFFSDILSKFYQFKDLALFCFSEAKTLFLIKIQRFLVGKIML